MTDLISLADELPEPPSDDPADSMRYASALRQMVELHLEDSQHCAFIWGSVVVRALARLEHRQTIESDWFTDLVANRIWERDLIECGAVVRTTPL